MEWNDCPIRPHAVHSSASGFQKPHPRSPLERRSSSRRFSYGYLVTTSPQSWIIPWAAAPNSSFEKPVSLQTSSTIHFRDVTGGVYKARERIHGSVLICHYRSEEHTSELQS